MKLPPFPERDNALPHSAGKSVADMRTCAMCGQTFDMRDLYHAHHHTKEAHAPLPSS